MPELERLRQKHLPLQPADHAQANSLGAKAAGLQLEVLARFPSACGRAAGAERCVLSVLGGDGAAATTVTLAPELGLVLVNATSQGNGAVRAGPLPPPDARGGWSVHAIVDHSILEVPPPPPPRRRRHVPLRQCDTRCTRLLARTRTDLLLFRCNGGKTQRARGGLLPAVLSTRARVGAAAWDSFSPFLLCSLLHDREGILPFLPLTRARSCVCR